MTGVECQMSPNFQVLSNLVPPLPLKVGDANLMKLISSFGLLSAAEVSAAA